MRRLDYIYLKQRQYNDHKLKDEVTDKRARTLPPARTQQ